MKIAIIGYSGSGKSTLAEALGALYRAEVMHLDCVHFLPGWREREASEEQAIVARFLDTHDAWIIDGNYGKLLYERRLFEADKIIFLNFNRFSCLCRVLKRRLKYKGKTRASMAEGCEEKMDWEFIKWILRNGRTRQLKERYASVCARYKEKTAVISAQRELDAFLKAEKLARKEAVF